MEGGKEVEQEEEDAREKRMAESEEQRTILRENLGDSLRTKRRQEIMN
jgi:hypothetical protein